MRAHPCHLYPTRGTKDMEYAGETFSMSDRKVTHGQMDSPRGGGYFSIVGDAGRLHRRMFAGSGHRFWKFVPSEPFRNDRKSRGYDISRRRADAGSVL